MKVYLDGKLIDADKATVSIRDAAVQHGIGLFETMQAYDGTVFRLDAHVARLIESARALGLTDRLKPDALAEAVELTVAKNDLPEARVRLTVTGGDLSLLAQAKSENPDKAPGHQPSIVITCEKPTVYPEAFFEQGVAVVLADPKANPLDPLSSHKTLNYWSRLSTLVAAARHGAGESLWFSVTNHLVGGSVSNVILVKDGQLLTPMVRGEEPDGALPSPVLPGITRAAVLELAESLDLPIVRRMLSINDVLEADEVMLTNSSWLILPVVRVEKESVGTGEPGPITKQLHAGLLSVIRSECSGDDGAAPDPTGEA